MLKSATWLLPTLLVALASLRLWPFCWGAGKTWAGRAEGCASLMEALRGLSELVQQRPRCKFPNLAATPQRAPWRGALHPSGKGQRNRAGQDPRGICLYLSAILTHSLSVGQ